MKHYVYRNIHTLGERWHSQYSFDALVIKIESQTTEIQAFWSVYACGVNIRVHCWVNIPVLIPSFLTCSKGLHLCIMYGCSGYIAMQMRECVWLNECRPAPPRRLRSQSSFSLVCSASWSWQVVCLPRSLENKCLTWQDLSSRSSSSST